MAKAARYLKLGFYTLLIVALGVGSALWLGLRAMQPAMVYYHCYFDTSVQGLDVGAAVKFRGVGVGAVERITLATDSRHVDVLLGLEAARVQGLHLDEADTPIRARAVMVGVTGVKIIDLDVVDPRVSPRSKLPFKTAPNTIATAPSLVEGVEGGVEEIARHLPQLLDQLSGLVQGLSAAVGDLHDHHIIEKVERAVDEAGAAASELKVLARGLDSSALPQNVSRALGSLNEALAKVNVALDRVGGDGGLVSSAQRATDAFGDVGRSANASAARLETTLRDVDEAARAIRDLALELQVQPDILVKGRARSKGAR
jgi:ABC-type transporter Mla subunit MlaD